MSIMEEKKTTAKELFVAKYPEHAKFEATCERYKNQRINVILSGFLDFLEFERGINLAAYDEDNNYFSEYFTKETLIAEFLEVDLLDFENEKLAMLEEIKEANAKAMESQRHHPLSHS